LHDSSCQRNWRVCVRYLTTMVVFCACGSNPPNSAIYEAILNLIIAYIWKGIEISLLNISFSVMLGIDILFPYDSIGSRRIGSKHIVRLHSWLYRWPFCPPYWFLNEVINKRPWTCHKCTHWPWKPYPRHQNECPILYRTRDIGHFRDCKNGCRIFGHNFFSTSNFCVDFFFCVPYNI